MQHRPNLKVLKPERPSADQFQSLVLKNRVTAHKLAFHVVRYWNLPIDREEIVGAADLALCEAAARFDDSKGAKFSTYLFYVLRGALVRSLSQDRMHGAFSVDSLNEKSGIESEEIDFMSDSVERTSEIVSSPEELTYQNELKKLCAEAFQHLTSLEKTVVAEVIVNEGKVARVARGIGYSRGHLSEVKRNALRKMKKELSDVRGDSYKEAA